MAVLALIDLWSRSRLPGRAAVAAFWGTGFDRREMTHNPTLRAQAVLVAWILGCFAGIALVGLLAAAPVFCGLFVRFAGRRPILTAIVVAAGVLLFQYAIFEWLLDYRLYRGAVLHKGWSGRLVAPEMMQGRKP